MNARATLEDHERAPWSDEPDAPTPLPLAGDDPLAIGAPARRWPEPENRGRATLSDLGDVEYVEDLGRPGRIVVVAAEEGSGKSYTWTGELGIRVAVAGGSLAGTWPVLRTGPVLVLSEMHTDDDYHREAEILASLGLERSALDGRYWRLPLMTAAGSQPALRVADWRAWVTDWLRDRAAILMIVDTATGATQVDPWGRDIQAVYRDLRSMLEDYPELLIVLVVHVKKPTGRGDRRISDVLGEWGRWCDVVVIQERDGPTRTKVATYKRVRHERRIVATKAGGLLVDPIDAATAAHGSKVKSEAVLAAILASPGLTYAELGAAIGVSEDTAGRYVRALGDQVDARRGAAASGPGAKTRIYPVSASPHVTAHTGAETAAETHAGIEGVESPHAAAPYIGAAALWRPPTPPRLGVPTRRGTHSNTSRRQPASAAVGRVARWSRRRWHDNVPMPSLRLSVHGRPAGSVVSAMRTRRPPTTRRGGMTAYSAEWRRLVAEAIAAGATCADCGTARALEGDHELPVSRGGLSTRANLAIRCRRCNRSKGNRITAYQLRVPWPVTPRGDTAP